MKTTKRLFALLLVLTIVVTYLPPMAAQATTGNTEEYAGGTGTKEDPYVIMNSSAFLNIAGSNDYYVLGADISINDDNWNAVDFDGNLDGLGHTISFTYEKDANVDVALFNKVSGKIENLTLVVAIDIYSGYAAGLCLTNIGEISDCVVKAKGISARARKDGSAAAAGICYSNYGSITKCTVSGTINVGSDVAYYGGSASGICGTNEGEISECINLANIYAQTASGIARSSGGTIKQCINAGYICATGKINYYSAYANGIANSSWGLIQNCINFSEVYCRYGTQYAGGITSSKNGSVINCISAGLASGTSSSCKSYQISPQYTSCYYIGDLQLTTSGCGLVIKETYTKDDFPKLDFETIWYMTPYGIPSLKDVGAKLEGAIIEGDNDVYVGKSATFSVMKYPEDALLWSFSWVAENCNISATPFTITPTQIGNTRLIVSDMVLGSVAFKNLSVGIATEEIVITGSKQVDVGKRMQLSAEVLPENASNKNIIWSTTSSCISIDENGLVTGISPGMAIVYATSADGFVKKASYEIQVVCHPESVILNQDNTLIYVGQTTNLTATVLPEETTDKSLCWTSNNEDVATVTDGVVTAVHPGVAIINATTIDGGISASCAITVGINATSIAITGPDSVDVGNSIQLHYSVQPDNTSEPGVIWSVTSPTNKLVSIDENGVVTGLEPGFVVIQATSLDGFAVATKEIQVVLHPESVTLDAQEIWVKVGETYKVTASVTPENATDISVTWTSENNSIACVANGEIVGVMPGQTEIIVTTNDQKKTAKTIVNVYRPATSLELSETDITICTGTTYQVTGIVLPKEATYHNLVLSSPATNVKIDPKTQTIYAQEEGTAVIKVSTAREEVVQTLFITVVNHSYNTDGVHCDNCGRITDVNFTVVFKDWNSAVLSSENYQWGDKITVPANPHREADNTYTYTFAGWDSEVSAVANGSVTYTATYASSYIDYTIEFKNWDGTVISSNTYHYGDSVAAPADPTRTDGKAYTYTFAGWDKKVVNCAGNTTYTATYDAVYNGIPGDIDGNEEVSQDDAVYLLLHTMFGEAFYPLNGVEADIDGNGTVEQDDAVYLLLHTMFGETFYPLNTPALPAKTKE